MRWRGAGGRRCCLRATTSRRPISSAWRCLRERLTTPKLPGAPDQGVGRQRWVERLLRALSAGDRQLLRVDQSELDQDRGLVPVDVFVGQFPVAEADDGDQRDLDAPPGRGNAR